MFHLTENPIQLWTTTYELVANISGNKPILNARAYKPSQLEAPFQERAPFGEREILNLSIPFDTCYLCVLTIIRVLNIREFTKLYFTYIRAVVKKSLQKEGRRVVNTNVVMRTAGKKPSPSIKYVLVLSLIPREETAYMTKGKFQRSLCSPQNITKLTQILFKTDCSVR